MRMHSLRKETKELISETSEKFCGSRLLITAINGFSIWSLIVAIVLNVAFVFRRNRIEKEDR